MKKIAFRRDMFITLDDEGKPVVEVPEGVIYLRNYEYAAWCKEYSLEPGHYPITFMRDRGVYTHPYSERFVEATPEDATYVKVAVLGTVVGGDLGSRFGGVRTSALDPITREVGTQEVVPLSVDVDYAIKQIALLRDEVEA